MSEVKRPTLAELLAEYDAADAACGAAKDGPTFRLAEARRLNATLALVEGVRSTPGEALNQGGSEGVEQTLRGDELMARADTVLARTEGMTPDLKLVLETGSYDGDDLGYGQTEFPWRYAVSTGQGLHIETGVLGPELTDPDARVIEAAPEMRALLLALRAQVAELTDRNQFLSVSEPGELLDQGRNEGAVHAAQRLLAIARGEPHRGQFGDPTLEAAAQAVAGMRAALGHYANIYHYDVAGRVWTGNPDEDAPHEVDMGDIARRALPAAPSGHDTPERSVGVGEVC